MNPITKRCNPAAMGADFQWSTNPSRRADRRRSAITMDPSLRTVNQIPLDRLWDSEGDIVAARERWLSHASLREMLRIYPVEFFVADIGHPLRRIDVSKCYDFWKREVESHLVDDQEAGFRQEDFPGEYAYSASEWSGEIQTPIVLLEKHH